MSMPVGNRVNIIIGGQGSYIGENVCRYLNKKAKYTVIELNLRDPSWRTFDFSQIDVVFQVAGVAHQKEINENTHLYYQVNRDLAVEVAEIAKAAGVKQYIYMSSMSVYGCNESPEDIKS